MAYQKSELGDGVWTQCMLRQEQTIQIAWIQAKFAQIGKTVRIPNNDGSWEVIEVYQTKKG